MPQIPKYLVTLAVALAVVAGPASKLTAQSWDRVAPILPAPLPFTLNSYDVIQAVQMIRSEPALLLVNDNGTRATIPVRTARSIWVDFNPDAYENHQKR